MSDAPPVFWPVARLITEYRARRLSPVEVTEEMLARIDRFDDRLHSYLTVTPDLARRQALEAERRYRSREPVLALQGVPTAIKDLFDVAGVPTTLGSRVYRDHIAAADSAVVGAVRGAGAVLLGKTNTSEFGQSATTENLLGPGCRNPWASGRTAGGSSGGAAASVGAGLATVALGSDGGGSVRIPAALCGLVGLKPTFGGVEDGSSFQAMTAFTCPGPIARRVADIRVFMGAVWGRALPRRMCPRLRIAWCARPEQRPVAPGVVAGTQAAIETLAGMGHEIDAIEMPALSWLEAFGPLVLADEWRYRRHLLDGSADQLTRYARRTIEQGEHISESHVRQARARMAEVGSQIAALFEAHDVVVTPTTATTAFAVGRRPTQIDGRDVDSLWGPFPFTAPFNVAGTPAVSLPCGLSDGLPVGLQLVGGIGGDDGLLDVCEDLEDALGFPADELTDHWPAAAGSGAADAEQPGKIGHVVEDGGSMV
ncbi:MAG TPA: amidase [Solirubrobacteraceae bacterium]|nr:amidase [Solirubrobacteraceae bacterium]